MATSCEAVDIFDPKNFRKPSDPRLVSTTADSVLPAIIEVRKPHASEFIRVRPDEGFRFTTSLLAMDSSTKRRSELYLLHPQFEIPPALSHFVHDYLLAQAITLERVPFLYWIKHSDTTWYDSAVEAMNVAQTKWVHVIAAADKQAYVVEPASDDLPDPTWPALTFRDFLERAFAARTVRDLQHPVVRKLLGKHGL
jgi:hypothetical protein